MRNLAGRESGLTLSNQRPKDYNATVSVARPRFSERLRRLPLYLVVAQRYYWKAKERRESGEDKREFGELLKQASIFVSECGLGVLSNKFKKGTLQLAHLYPSWEPRNM